MILDKWLIIKKGKSSIAQKVYYKSGLKLKTIKKMKNLY